MESEFGEFIWRLHGQLILTVYKDSLYGKFILTASIGSFNEQSMWKVYMESFIWKVYIESLQCKFILRVYVGPLCGEFIWTVYIESLHGKFIWKVFMDRVQEVYMESLYG